MPRATPGRNEASSPQETRAAARGLFGAEGAATRTPTGGGSRRPGQDGRCALAESRSGAHAYLVYLGVKALRASWKDRARTAGFTPAPSSSRGSVRAGFLVGLTNPKSVVFLTAMLPQFVDRQAGHATIQMPIPGLAGAVLALLSDGVWGLTAAAARTWFGRSPKRMSPVGGTSGLAMIGLGATVAITGRAD
ncbi:LysE family translocator [Streptomyces sp. NPDC047071]|uniref:LysE family translocator n=1 Tax=Streptomyces sp. NPDC047071 TaxID=3154808 RepID=UPI00345365F6